MLENVDESLDPMRPDLPIPLKIVCPVQFSSRSIALVHIAQCLASDRIRWITDSIAFVSAERASQINECSADKLDLVCGREAFMKL